MNDFESYKLYISLKNHFSKPSYNYFKYNGKSNLKYESYLKRKDKIFFQKLAKHEDVQNFLLSNFCINDKLWIKDLAYSEESEKNYKEWVKRQNSLSYIFKNDLEKLDNPFDSNFIITDSSHPNLLKLYLRKDISIETFCILLDLSGAIKHWDNKLRYDPIWDEIRLKVIKYTPFIKYDKEKIKKICVDYFSDLE